MSKLTKEAMKIAKDSNVPVKPEQLLLFTLDQETEEKFYNHLLDFYDAMPKFFSSKYRAQFPAGEIGPVRRDFVWHGAKYTLDIMPGITDADDGKPVPSFPGEMVELIDDAIRKMATEGQIRQVNGKVGMFITLSSIRRELKKWGHEYSIRQIKNALLLGGTTRYRAISKDGNGELQGFFNLFNLHGLKTSTDWMNHDERAAAFLEFNMWVASGIQSGNYRQIHYKTSMEYKRTLARWFHKRLVLNYKQAARNNNYNILHSTVLRDSGRGDTISTDRKSFQTVKEALEELKEKGVIASYTVDNTHDADNPRRIADKKYILIPTDEFIQEVKRANFKQGEVRQRLGGPVIDSVDN